MKNYLISALTFSSLVVAILPGCIKELDCGLTKDCASAGGTAGSGDGDGDSGGTSSGGIGASDSGGSGGGEEPACDPACSGDTLICDEDAGECVECLKTSDCTDALCDAESNTCVECLEATDCLDPTRPVCDSGSCSAGCEGDDECSRFVDTPVCDDSSGTCVVCTPGTEEARCGAKSCDPATLECGPNDRGSRGTCRSCISDSDCGSNHQCVPMEYPKGTAREGGYCLEMSGSCGEPYTVVISGKITLSGVSGQSYCGINEDLTTCEAVRALEDNLRCDSLLAGDGQCWPAAGTIADAVAVPGALCRKFKNLAGERCTYECGGSPECPTTASQSTCGEGALPAPTTPNFCGGEPQ